MMGVVIIMKNYRKITEQWLTGIASQGFVYEHLPTGAKICLIKNQDKNKVFSIAFRTPPFDDSGVAHILEHSVLNGSKRYPVKDPFIQMAKSSLNTFINAMTYPDKTVYPIASQNLKDYHNLMKVYLDAVFYPNIYQEPKIFQQEGWHYDCPSEDQPVIYKGVVYNEMQGVFSTPEQVLFRHVQKELFPNHPYGYDSGGVPEAIPTLSYERFLDFHKQYYHPSNSYIYYYGDIVIEDELRFLDEAYLKDFEKKEIDSAIPLIESWTQPRQKTLQYPVMDDENIDNKAYLSVHFLIGQVSLLDEVGLLILEYLLMEAPGALLKEKLLAAGYGEDIFADYDHSIRQGTWSIIAKNGRLERKEAFVQAVFEGLKELQEQGIDRRKLHSSLNNFEFKMREADFGSSPKGVVYNLKMLEGWLHGDDPLAIFDYDTLFEQLRVGVEEGLFEEYISRYLLTNQHYSVLCLEPSSTLAATKKQVSEQMLDDYKKQLSASELAALVSQTQELMAYQAEKDSPEAVASLPRLSLADIEQHKKFLDYQVEYKEDINILYHRANTSGIVYLKAFFDASWIDHHYLPMVKLLSTFLTVVSSKHHHYSALADEINDKTGGIGSALRIYSHKSDSNHFEAGLQLGGKSFTNRLGDLLNLLREILLEPDFTDVKRLKDLLNEERSDMQMAIVSDGHLMAAKRVLSYTSKMATYEDLTSGIAYYRFLESWAEKSETDLLELGHLLKKLCAEIVSQGKLTMAITYDESDESSVKMAVVDFLKTFRRESEWLSRQLPEQSVKQNEAFITTGNINYVAQATNYKKYGYDYHGSYKVANRILSSTYLWDKVRVEGGAYGAMSEISRTGDILLVSYRDPNIEKTYERYLAAADYLMAFEEEQEALDSYIIGTISRLDHPLTPSMETARMMMLYFAELKQEDIERERAEIIKTTVTDIQRVGKVLKTTFADIKRCTFGTEEAINKDKACFERIEKVQ